MASILGPEKRFLRVFDEPNEPSVVGTGHLLCFKFEQNSFNDRTVQAEIRDFQEKKTVDKQNGKINLKKMIIGNKNITIL